MGRDEESVLWDLDRHLGIAEPLGVTDVELVTARSRAPYPLATGWAYGGGFEGTAGSGGGHHHGAGGGGGEAGGCSGGGCSGGGGGCGGGS